jgi:hypothetical protein
MLKEKPVAKTKKTLRKKRKNNHYKTGIHVSTKCPKPIHYRSSWEKIVCCYLDAQPNVVSYSYEALIIPYKSNIRTARIKKYIPDFIVEYADGTKKIVEVKRENQLNNPFVKKKAEAALAWCNEHANQKITYEFWTEKIIRPLMKVYQAEMKKI